MPSRLLVSIHDVGPRFEREVDILIELLSRRLGSMKFAMLVVPDHWGAAPISADRPFQKRLRKWAGEGAEMFLHGLRHRADTGRSGSVMARFKGKALTAGEGEFLELDHDEAMHRIRIGRQVIEDAIGQEVAGFIAPAWLYGPGAQSAIRESGFHLAEDHFRVWSPVTGAVLARGPVITWASRSKPRIASSLLFAAFARSALGAMPTVRIAVHPGDTGVSALLKSIDRTLQRFADGRAISHYRDLLPGGVLK